LKDKLLDRLSNPSTYSFIKSHILPRNRNWQNQTSHVLFVSKYTVSSPATLTSARNILSLAMVLARYILGSKRLYTIG